MKKTLLALSLAVLGAILTACGTPSSNESTESNLPQAGDTKQLKNITISYGNHLGCSLYFIAKELGYFEENGLNVELVLNANAADAISAINSGKIDAASVGTTATLSSIAQNTDLVIYGGQMHEGSGIICKPEDKERYSDFQNYRGKTLGLVRMSTGDVVFRYGLVKAGLEIGKDVNIVELDSAASITEAVKKGEVDCGGSWIPNLANAEAQGLAIAMLSGEVIVNHPCATMVTSSKMMKENPDDYKQVHKALIKAFDVFENDPDKAIPLIQKYLELDTEVIKKDAYSRFSPNPEINETAVKEFWTAMKEIDYIQSDIDISKHIDSSAYDAAMKEMIQNNPDNEFYKEVAKGGYGSNAK